MSITSDQIRTVGFIHGLADDAADEIEELEKEVDALKAERDELLALLVFAASTIKSEYPESQWDEYRIPEIDAAIAKAERGAA